MIRLEVKPEYKGKKFYVKNIGALVSLVKKYRSVTLGDIKKAKVEDSRIYSFSNVKPMRHKANVLTGFGHAITCPVCSSLKGPVYGQCEICFWKTAFKDECKRQKTFHNIVSASNEKELLTAMRRRATFIIKSLKRVFTPETIVKLMEEVK